MQLRLSYLKLIVTPIYYNNITSFVLNVVRTKHVDYIHSRHICYGLFINMQVYNFHACASLLCGLNQLAANYLLAAIIAAYNMLNYIHLSNSSKHLILIWRRDGNSPMGHSSYKLLPHGKQATSRCVIRYPSTANFQTMDKLGTI